MRHHRSCGSVRLTAGPVCPTGGPSPRFSRLGNPFPPGGRRLLAVSWTSNQTRVACGLHSPRSGWQLPHRVGWDNSDAFDPLALDRSAFFATTRDGRDITELAEHVVASDQWAEGGILTV